MTVQIFATSPCGARSLALLLPVMLLGWIGPSAAAAPMAVTESKYYTIHSDLNPVLVREAATRMDCMAEEYYERTRGLAVGQINRKFKFMLFSRREDYRAAGGPDGSIGVFMASPAGSALAALRLEDHPEQLWHTIQHEGFHQFSHEVLRGGRGELPIWLEEGLADYFGYAQFTGEDLVSGVIPPDRLAMVQQMMLSNRFRPLTKLMSISHRGWLAVADGVDYLESWSVVQYLVHAEDGRFRPGFERFIRACLAPNGKPVALGEFIIDGQDLEKNWRAWWQAQQPDITRDLYARAAATALCAYLGRATALKQSVPNINELLHLVDIRQLKLSDADWLPPSLADSIRTWMTINGPDTRFELGKDPRLPQVLVTLSDGTHLTATYNLAARSRRVTIMLDALGVEIAKATDLMEEAKQLDARKLLIEAMRKYPKSPQLEEARKLIQKTYATASATPTRPPVVITPKPPVGTTPNPALASSNPPSTAKPSKLPAISPLMVVSARYGNAGHWANVTDQVREMVKGRELALPKLLSIELGLDPHPGFLKYIDMIIMVNGVPMRIYTAENEDAPPFKITAEAKPE